MNRIAIQGVAGAFHEIAATEFFSNEKFETVQCNTFADLFDAMQFGQADYAVVAIENSVAGSIIPNYASIRKSGLKILGEVYLRIEQHLVGLPGQEIETITEVQSHPMALQQCMEFLDPLRRKGVVLVDSEDTALSAKRISENGLKNSAAVASDLAAKMYGLEILARNIETNKKNFTRFLVLSNSESYKRHMQEKTANKASICFKLPHEEGSLSRVLSAFATYKVNLTKIQSLPIVGKEWQYLFYTDLVYADYSIYQAALDAIKPLTNELMILGEYEKGLLPVENKTITNELKDKA